MSNVLHADSNANSSDARGVSSEKNGTQPAENTIMQDLSQAFDDHNKTSSASSCAPQTRESLPLHYAKTIAVIDGNSLMHRAFHAIMQPMSAPDGRSTNALLGFFNMFIKLVRSFSPDGIICAFDKGKPQVRIDMLPQYKAQRPPMDPSLHEQFPMVKDLLRALQIPVVELQGWEGDDILGTLAHQGELQGYSMLLFTGDRDIYQLATQHVSVVSTKKGVSDVRIMTPEDVDDLYHGITPNLVPDFYGLKGDTSDNIPGVPGIGPKRAAALIVEYGSLEGVIAHADQVSGKMGENLRNHIDDARLSKRVATIRRDAPITVDLSAAAFPTFDPAEVARAFCALGFTNLVPKLLRFLPSLNSADIKRIIHESATSAKRNSAILPASALNTFASADSPTSSVQAHAAQASILDSRAGCSQTVPASEEEQTQSEVNTSAPDYSSLFPACVQTQAHAFIKRVVACGTWVACAYEPASMKSTQANVQPSFEMLLDTHTLWVTDGTTLAQFSGADVSSVLQTLVKSGHVVALNCKALLHVLYPPVSSEPASLELSDISTAALFDVGLAAYLLNSDANDYSWQTLCNTYLPTFVYPDTTDDTDEPNVYALEAIAVRALYPVLRELLHKDNSDDLFYELELPLIPVLLHMERNGIYCDKHLLAEQSRALSHELNAMSLKLRQLAQQDFNIDSPMQLSHVLFDVWGLPTKGLKKTRRGYYSTNAQTLASLSMTDERVQLILDYRERMKIKNTYLDALVHDIRSDGRIHSTFNQTIAATGRLSSSDPNLQNIPTRSSLGHRVRKAFVLPHNHLFLACDYSQIELRLLAHLSKDEHLIHAFQTGADFHAATAARIFHVSPDEVTPALRSRAKAVNFGIVYGQQAFGLATSLKISRKEAQEMIDRYFDAYPGVRKFLDESVQFAREHSYVPTMYGRKRHIAQIDSRNFQLRSFAERTAMNHPMQGSAADIIKLAMIEVEKQFAQLGLASKLILQIHDELDFEVVPEELERVSSVVKRAMEGVVTLRVPLIAEISYADNWADAKQGRFVENSSSKEPKAANAARTNSAKPQVIIWTDGSSRGNPGPGGYGAVMLFYDRAGREHKRELSCGYRQTTNNRMELLAPIIALEELKYPCKVELHSDSQYVIHAFQQHWIDGWQKRGWKTANKQPVKNVDLWKRLLRAMQPHEMSFVWVKGHAGTELNERCDELATTAADGDISQLQVDEGFEALS